MAKPLKVRIKHTRTKLANTRKTVRKAIRRRRKAKSDNKKRKRARNARRLKRAVKRIARRLRSLLKQKRKQRRKRGIVVKPGAPHWGGADDILRREADPVALRYGFRPNSKKRTQSYGNPGSDHHTSQTTASARDYPTSNNHTLKNAIAREIVGRNVADYENVYFKRAGRTYRLQAIASTHGTGPHLHCGIRLYS